MKSITRLPATLGMALFLLIPALTGRSDELTQDFASWPITTPVTTTNQGWSITNGPFISSSPTNFTLQSLRFSNTSSNGALNLPYVTNGAGKLSFYVRTTGTTTLRVEQSDDNINWNTISNFTVSSSSVFNPYQITINRYGGSYYRILIPGIYIYNAFIDDVSLSKPPTAMQFPSVTALTTLGSPEIFVSDSVNINAIYSTIGVASNIQMTLFYKFGLGGISNSIAMISNGPNSFITSTPIPGQAEGNVYYFITASFEGPGSLGALSPTNYPAGGFTNTVYYSVAVRPYNMQNNSMVVTGAINSVMTILQDYVWESIASYSSSSFSIQFEGVRSEK